MDGGLYTIYQTSDVDNFMRNDGTVLDMYSENQTEPILIIIQQGLHNDVVTILRKLLQQRTYHSTIHFWVCGSHGFRCSSPQRTVKWTDKDQVTHMEQCTTTWTFTKRKQIRF
jgi:hypothetical protein